MNEWVMSGLRGSHTLGALAAFGLLRVASRLNLPQPVKLGWVAQPDWVARLCFPEPVSREALLDQLVQAIAERVESPELSWRADLKPTPGEYRQFAIQQLAKSNADQREGLDFLAAFGMETVMMANGKGLRPTALDMTSASNKFLRDLWRVVKDLHKKGDLPGRLAECLFGPWQQQDNLYALGWDCEAERLHAYEAIAPTNMRFSSVFGAIWLAYEALPLFPVAGVENRLLTTAFDTRNHHFSWAVWEPPLTLSTVRSLLGLAGLSHDQPSLDELRLRGVRMLYRSQRAELMQGRATFRPPVLV